MRSTICSSSSRRGGEVEPGEALAAGPEARPRAERHPAALGERGGRVVAEAERRGSRARRGSRRPGGCVADLGQALGQQLGEQRGGCASRRASTGVEPLVAVARRRRPSASAPRWPQWVATSGRLATRSRVRLAGGDRLRALEPGEVEGLRGRGEHDPALGGRPRDGRGSAACSAPGSTSDAWISSASTQPSCAAAIAATCSSSARVGDRAGRVVRVAENQRPGPGGEGAVDPLEVERRARGQRDTDHRPPACSIRLKNGW